MSHTIHTGDVLEVLRTFESSTFDGCLTDPPYGLTFLGAQWDKGVPSSTVWSELLRVLKPGASLLAFGGTRTFHRLTTAIEDGGFEIRDCLMWLYGTGFPKSMDISKALDRAAGVQRVIVGQQTKARAKGGNSAIPTLGTETEYKTWNITSPATAEAKQWKGYGTTLKPGWEPCVLAMKPISNTFAENAATYGVAGLNIDGSRIGTDIVGWGGGATGTNSWASNMSGTAGKARPVEGRWPANVVLDESFTQDWSRYFYCPKASKNERDAGLDDFELKARPTMGSGIGGQPNQQIANNRNTHPCVKPIELNRYLANLILPPARESAPRRLLVPFSGSGSEMISGLLAGWEDVVGIEKQPEYVSLAQARIKYWNH